jgi:hypothetical protein
LLDLSETYTEPVVTRCGLYFCSACAIKRFGKTPKCLAWGTSTGGIFNRADKIIEKMNKKRKEGEEGQGSGDSEADANVQIEGLDERQGSDAEDQGKYFRLSWSFRKFERSFQDKLLETLFSPVVLGCSWIIFCRIFEDGSTL